MKKSIIGVAILFITSLGLGCQKENTICDSTTSPITEANCSAPYIDTRDGQAYCTVTIGNQVWMAENMRFDTPDTIIGGIDGIPKDCNISELMHSSTNTISDYKPIFGRYYNEEAAKYACPQGWHLPSDEEWKILEYYIGMDSVSVNDYYWRGSHANQLKSTTLWTTSVSNGIPSTPANNGTNVTGFNAYPAGYLGYDSDTKLSSLIYTGAMTFFHSAPQAAGRSLHWESQIFRGNLAYPSSNLQSCRCIKD